MNLVVILNRLRVGHSKDNGSLPQVAHPSDVFAYNGNESLLERLDLMT